MISKSCDISIHNSVIQTLAAINNRANVGLTRVQVLCMCIFVFDVLYDFYMFYM